MFPSPMVDFGYDISDYKGIDPIFGTMEDFKKLLRSMKDKSKVLYLIVNYYHDIAYNCILHFRIP